MSEVPTYIEKIIKQLPDKEILVAQDLVDAGIVEDQSSLVTWRKNGTGPRFILFSPHKIIYQKSDVVEWLKNRPYGTRRSSDKKPLEIARGRQGSLAGITNTPALESAAGANGPSSAIPIVGEALQKSKR